MARSDLLLNLVRAGSLGDQVGFRRTVEAMIAEERERQHHVVADRLAEYLANKTRAAWSPGRASDLAERPASSKTSTRSRSIATA